MYKGLQYMTIYTHTLVEVYSLTKVVYIRQRISTLKINIFNTLYTYICITNIKHQGIHMKQCQHITKNILVFQNLYENNKRSR
ncbi:hypothetical protein Hanom_Chr08g00725241 [Helianthus anomalus]